MHIALNNILYFCQNYNPVVVFYQKTADVVLSDSAWYQLHVLSQRIWDFRIPKNHVPRAIYINDLCTDLYALYMVILYLK